MSVNPNSEIFWKSVISRLFSGGSRISVPKTFHQRQRKIDELLENDYTGIVATVMEFMITTGTVNFNFVTDNTNLTDKLQAWADHQVNANISPDVPRGLKALTSQYLRERYRSSFIVLNIVWEKIGDLILPGKMWLNDGGQIMVGGDSETLDGKEYYLGSEDNRIISTDKKTILIRKPFNAWYDDYPTQYLVKKGVLYNAMLKKAIISKQADVIEELIPYILMMRAGDANMFIKGQMGDVENQLTNLKDNLKKAKRAKDNQQDSGDMILKGRYDLQLDHLIPDLTKLFNSSIIEPINYDILAGLGLIELQGFSSNRQEAILNPKVLVEEIQNAVMDCKALYEEVLDLIVEKNSSIHPKHMGSDIRVVPGVVKAFLTDSMRKLIKDYTNTGELAIEDSFEGLPIGFDFKISKQRRQNEEDNGDVDLFFPRVILNQDSNTKSDTPLTRTPTPNEVPKKPVKKMKADNEYLEAPYKDISKLPDNVKNVLPEAAQRQWLEVFNSIYNRTKNEDRSRKGAWATIKKSWKRNPNGEWVRK